MKKILKYYEEYLGGILFSVMFITLIIQIFSRQILNKPLIWTEEVARLVFVYIAMLGVTLGIKYDQHVGIEVLSDKFSPRAAKVMDIVKTILTGIIIVLLIVIGLGITKRKASLDLISLGISSGYLYGALPLGGVMMGIRYIEKIYYRRKAKKLNEVEVR
ncbi:TRAP transporter small permease [Fusobacteria bacterium ZRK30]|nr:TRAP transporter small permease [Fusobacteria bacterium ZRK30]